jgi:hypothetical protein
VCSLSRQAAHKHVNVFLSKTQFGAAVSSSRASAEENNSQRLGLRAGTGILAAHADYLKTFVYKSNYILTNS